MHARTLAILLSALALLTLAGCSLFQSSSSTAGSSRPEAGVAITPHNPVSLHNYKAARAYSAEGRLELAREHYLLAYAAAEGDGPLRAALEREIRAVNMMIRTVR